MRKSSLSPFLPTPLTLIALSYAAGIFLGYAVHIPFPYLYSILLLSTITAFILLLRKDAISVVPLHLSIVLLGMAAYSFSLDRVAGSSILQFLGDGSKASHRRWVDLEGTVVKEPEEKKNKLYLVVRVETINSREASGRIQAIVFRGGRVGYGDRVRLTGNLSLPSPPRNPGEPDYRQILLRKGIVARMWVSKLEYLGRGMVNPLVRFSLGIKDRMEKRLERDFQDEKGKLTTEGAFLQGILLGNRWLIPEGVKESFKLSGTLHVQAISGLHVGLVGTVFFFLFKVLRFPPKLRAGFTIPLLVLFALLTGARPSVVRAVVMAASLLLGMIMDRETDYFHRLALAGLFILILNPLQLFDAGFQLSFMVVASIIYLSPRIESVLHNIERLPRWLTKSFSVIFSAQVGVIPLVAYYFNLFTPIALLANLIVVPLIGIVLAWGFVAILFGALNLLPLATVFNVANGFLIHWIITLVVLLSRLPLSSIHVPRLPVILIIGYYLFLGAFSRASVFRKAEE